MATSVPVPIATVAPAQPATTLAPIDVPTIPRGGAALRIAGKEVPLKITRFDNQLLLNAANFDAAFSGVRTDGSVVPLDTDGNIRLDKGDAIKVAVTGFAPGSQLEKLAAQPNRSSRLPLQNRGLATLLRPLRPLQIRAPFHAQPNSWQFWGSACLECLD